MKKSIVIVILLLFILSLNAEAKSNPEAKQITVVFRFDDYSSLSPTDIEVKVIDAFQKYNASCTFGVIPYICVEDVHDIRPQDVAPLTPMKADILKNAIKTGVLEIALHGYSHQTILERTDIYSEFSGLNYNTQVEKIAKGKHYLEKILDIQITTFIPPWSGYDLNTIRALEKLGIKTISANIRGVAEESSSLKFLPVTCHLTQLRGAVELARRVSDAYPVIVIIFHCYDFLEVNKETGKLTYQDFVELLAWVMSQKDIYVRSIDQTIKVIDDLSARRFINYTSCLKSLSLIPPFLHPHIYGVYFSSSTTYNLKIKYRIFTAFFYFALLVISSAIAFFGGFILFPRFRIVALICKYGGPILLILILIYDLRNSVVTYRGAMVMIALLGVCIGVWSSFLKLKKNKAISIL